MKFINIDIVLCYRASKNSAQEFFRGSQSLQNLVAISQRS